MQEFKIEERDAGQRLDKLLKKHLPEAGSSFLYKMLRKKNIVLNGKKAEGSELIAPGDTIRFFFSDETYAKFRGRPVLPAGTENEGSESGKGPGVEDRPAGATPGTEKRKDGKAGERKSGIDKERSDRPEERGAALSGKRLNGTGRAGRAERAYRGLKGIRVLYETEHLLFVDKPAGILSQSDASEALSLNDWVYGYALSKEIVKETDNYIPSVANRLDRNTSGIVMAALTYAGSRFLSEMIRDHRLRKYYEAIAEGRIEKDGELKGYLVKDIVANKVEIIRKNGCTDPFSDEIHTRYHILSYEKGYTYLEVELITGKSHQIRAHLSSIGHPIAGDKKYGGHPYHGQHIQQLRAVRVEFPVLDDDPFGMSGRIVRVQGGII